MKSLGMRFLLPFGLLAAAFSVFVIYQTCQHQREHSRELLSQQAALALQFNLAIRDYAAAKIRPVLESRLGKDEFIPEAMSTSFISRSIFEKVRRQFPDCVMHFASDNPRNPVNKASPDEQRMIEYFRKNPQVKEKVEEIEIGGRRHLTFFAPKYVKPECLRCHGDPKDAPADLIARYGAKASFHQTLGDVAALDTVAVPLDRIDAAATADMRRQSLILAGGFLLLFVSVAVVFRLAVTRRLTAMARRFREIAAGANHACADSPDIAGSDAISIAEAAMAAIRESETKYRTVIENMQDVLFRTDMAGNIVMLSPSGLRLLGLQRSEQACEINVARDLYADPKDRDHLLAALSASGEVKDYELTFKRPGGGLAYVCVNCHLYRDAGGRPEGIEGVLRDITERKQAEEALRDSEQLFRSFIESAPEAVFVQCEGRFVYLNPPMLKMLGARRGQDLLGTEFMKCMAPEFHEVIQARMRFQRETGLASPLMEQEYVRLDGSLVPVETTAVAIRYQGRDAHLVFVRDITERKRAEEALRMAARLDRLTGLPNRNLLLDRLQHAMLRHRRSQQTGYAVLFLDIDRFKNVNDSLGHDVGDQFVREVAHRLKNTVRAVDTISRDTPGPTAARLGGDEFVILLDSLASTQDACRVAERLLDVLSTPFRLGHHDIVSTASIGIVTSDHEYERAEDVLRDADTAMYEAKLAGRGRYVVFDVSMRQRVQNRLNLENDLRKAIDGDQLFLLYQPIVSLETGAVESFEALVRWRHPDRGLICPDEFIPIAEDTSLILPIGEWVLKEACRQFSRWRRERGDMAPPSISVNLSRNQLLLPGLPALIDRTLKETGLPPSSLHLEITESAVMRDVELATRVLNAINEIGVKLDLDDFGTGYSSLSCLHQFPLDVLKIDRSFVANVERGRDFAALIDAVTSLARNLGISIVAEGIETPAQLAVLQTLDCQFGQGYLFAKPLTAAEAAQFPRATGTACRGTCLRRILPRPHRLCDEGLPVGSGGRGKCT